MSRSWIVPFMTAPRNRIGECFTEPHVFVRSALSMGEGRGRESKRGATHYWSWKAVSEAADS